MASGSDYSDFPQWQDPEIEYLELDPTAVNVLEIGEGEGEDQKAYYYCYITKKRVKAELYYAYLDFLAERGDYPFPLDSLQYCCLQRLKKHCEETYSHPAYKTYPQQHELLEFQQRCERFYLKQYKIR